MDPDANLEELRRFVARIQMAQDKGRTTALDDVTRVVDLVDALDGWLSKGGLLPSTWRAPRPPASRARRAIEQIRALPLIVAFDNPDEQINGGDAVEELARIRVLCDEVLR